VGKDVKANREPEAIRGFTRSMLRDLYALERLVAEGKIEAGARRLGMEQELFLVDSGWRPAMVALEVLERLGHGAFTTELARYNLEINLEPLPLAGGCFAALERNLKRHIETVREASKREGAEVVLTGILPTLKKSDATLDNITPRDRYYALNDAMTRMRGGPARLQIQGIDELNVEHDSVMLESCNTSCQVHLQVSAEEFALLYNSAQAVLGPVLASCVNSPLLFGRRLWSETRIALFQQSVDTRAATKHLRDRTPRVRFGDSWVKSSVIELFQEDIVRFRSLLPTQVVEDPLAVLDEGGVPELAALQLHNSTVYRWNRPCYGRGNGKPHLRIECRAIPSGPTVLDEVANAALWIGSVLGLAAELGDVREFIDFDDAKKNFLDAARHGLNATFTWLNDETIGAKELTLDRLIPLARRGLTEADVDPSDVDHYLGVVEERVASCITGAQWLMRSLAQMKGHGTSSERLAALTAATATRQHEGRPGHEWPLARLEEGGGWKNNYLRVEQYMTTELFTVHENELVDLVAFLMDQKQIRHVLVEDDYHEIVGLVSYRSLLRLLTRGQIGDPNIAMPVKDVMVRDPITVPPETPTTEAIELMHRNRVSVLPVVKAGKLVGTIGERDFMHIARQFLEEKLKDQ
jgi:CBS domain-containing protein/gamma-glutamylcysteine synthetase